MDLDLLNSAITLLTGILLLCMMQTTFKDSALRFRLGIALIAAGLICMAIGPLWGASYVSLPQLLINAGLFVFVLMLRARQIEWSLEKQLDRLARCFGVRA